MKFVLIFALCLGAICATMTGCSDKETKKNNLNEKEIGSQIASSNVTSSKKSSMKTYIVGEGQASRGIKVEIPDKFNVINDTAGVPALGQKTSLVALDEMGNMVLSVNAENAAYISLDKKGVMNHVDEMVNVFRSAGISTEGVSIGTTDWSNKGTWSYITLSIETSMKQAGEEAYVCWMVDNVLDFCMIWGPDRGIVEDVRDSIIKLNS